MLVVLLAAGALACLAADLRKLILTVPLAWAGLVEEVIALAHARI